MTDDLTAKRLAALVALASSVPGQTLGRTAAVKLLYFVQELYGVELGYDFRLYTFGPYDAEVLYDLGVAKSLDALTERTVFYNVGYGYAINPGPKAESVKARAAGWLKANQSFFQAVAKEFGSWTASDLELGSTVLFVDREFHSQRAKATTEDVARRVQEIKPHFPEQVVLDRVKQFQAKGWLASIPK